MPNERTSDCLLVCTGGGCRKKQKKAFKALVSALSEAGVESGEVRCQGSCVGPTVVIVDEAGPRWFEDLRSSRAQADVVESVTRVQLGGNIKPSKRMKKRELTGKQRKKAAKRLAKQAA